MSIHLSRAQRVELKRDLFVFASAFVGTGVLDGHLTGDVIVAALIVAAKVTARRVFVHDEDAQA